MFCAALAPAAFGVCAGRGRLCAYEAHLCCVVLCCAVLCCAVLCCAESGSKSASSAAGTGVCSLARIFIHAICAVRSPAMCHSTQGGNSISTLPAWYDTSVCTVHQHVLQNSRSQVLACTGKDRDSWQYINLHCATAHAAEQFLTGPCFCTRNDQGRWQYIILHCAIARTAEQPLTGPCLYRERQRQLAIHHFALCNSTCCRTVPDRSLFLHTK